MECELKLLSVIIFYLFFIILCGSTGLLFDLHFGFIVGVTFATILLLVIFKYGEKFILLMAKARYITDDEHLINNIKNLCTHLEVPEIKVYWSHVYYNNVYYVNSYWGTPSIIIGKEVFNQLTKNELTSLVYATLLRIKNNDSKHRSTVNLITLFLFWWVFYFANKLSKSNFKNLIKVFLFPAFYIKSFIYKYFENHQYFDREIFKHESLKRDYIAAIFKINKLNLCLPYSAGALLLSGLSHTQNESNDVFMDLILESEVPIELRLKSITGNLNEN